MSRKKASREAQLLRRIEWRMALSFALAFLVFDVIVVGLTYEVLQYHFYSEAKAAIIHVWRDPGPPPKASLDADRDPHPGDNLPHVVTWQFNAQGQVTHRMTNLYGFPVSAATVLPNRSLLDRMPHTRTTLWTVTRYHSYRVMIGARPLWAHDQYQGAVQSAYSMGRLSSVIHGLLVVDGELGLVLAAVVIALVLWLSRRSLRPIQEALGRQRAFVQDVAHELRTPLTVVKSSLELALSERERPVVDQTLHDVISEVDYITRLTSDLAQLARVGSGSTQIQLAAVDLFRLADDVGSALQSLAREREITLAVTKHGGLSRIQADPTLVRQLMIILLDNALKYNDPGGRAELFVIVSAHRVEIRVENTGAGIPKHELPHLFDRFYRSRQTSRLAPGSPWRHHSR